MKTGRTLSPGSPGTKRLVEQYGNDLVCVRYRYDPVRNLKIKTVELIIEKAPWHKNLRKIPDSKITHLRIDYRETELRQKIRSVGGKWNKDRKVWELPYKAVTELGLEERIAHEEE